MGAVNPKSEYHETSDISALIPGEMTHKIKQYCSFPSFSNPRWNALGEEKKKESETSNSRFSRKNWYIWLQMLHL